MKTKKFKCPKCGCKRLEEVLINVTQSTAIEGVDEDGLLIYGNSSTEGGEIDRFQCLECGDVIKDEHGMTITSLNKLSAWIVGRAGKQKKPLPQAAQ